MFSQHRDVADRWKEEQKETLGKESFKKLPKRVKGSKSTPKKTKAAQSKTKRKKKK